MSKVDWSTAPEGATFYFLGNFRKDNFVWDLVEMGWIDSNITMNNRALVQVPNNDYERRPQQWPESDERVDILGQNGNDGLIYQQGDKMHCDEFREGQTPKIAISGKATGSPGGSGSNFAHDGELVTNSKYSRDVIGLDGTKTTIDVYRVLDAFNTGSAALDHAVKKILCPGNRHSKDRKQDLQEAMDSIAAELLLMSQR